MSQIGPPRFYRLSVVRHLKRLSSKRPTPNAFISARAEMSFLPFSQPTPPLAYLFLPPIFFALFLRHAWGLPLLPRALPAPLTQVPRAGLPPLFRPGPLSCPARPLPRSHLCAPACPYPPASQCPAPPFPTRNAAPTPLPRPTLRLIPPARLLPPCLRPPTATPPSTMGPCLFISALLFFCLILTPTLGRATPPLPPLFLPGQK